MGEQQHHADRERAIVRMRRLAEERRPGDELLASFLPAYYAELPEFDIDDRDDDRQLNAATWGDSQTQQIRNGD